MKTENHVSWNLLLYYVMDIYQATKKFKPGAQHGLGEKIRRAAISISVDVNGFRSTDEFCAEKTKVYLVLSSLSVLETYLQLAKQYKLLKDTRVLDEKLEGVKGAVCELLTDIK